VADDGVEVHVLNYTKQGLAFFLQVLALNQTTRGELYVMRSTLAGKLEWIAGFAWSRLDAFLAAGTVPGDNLDNRLST
jgi:hypothetical protein